jgi:hypothetical protein
LSLLELRVLFVDDVQFALPANDFAVNASFLDGCSNFHDWLFFKTMVLLFVAVRYSCFAQVVRAHFQSYLVTYQDLDIVHPHFA